MLANVSPIPIPAATTPALLKMTPVTNAVFAFFLYMSPTAAESARGNVSVQLTPEASAASRKRNVTKMKDPLFILNNLKDIWLFVFRNFRIILFAQVFAVVSFPAFAGERYMFLQAGLQCLFPLVAICFFRRILLKLVKHIFH